MRTTSKRKNALAILAFTMIIAAALMFYAKADPVGTTITFNTTDNGGTSSPSNRSDPGGTITTLVLDAVQQNTKWKAYIGNITGTLTLDDSSGFTIFEWALSASEISGEIYASRASSVSWSLINCSTNTTINTEETAIGFNSSAVDSINTTFNETTHATFVTAGITVTQNTCRATSTYVNETRQAQGSAYFQEILLDDDTNLIYATKIRQDTTGYDNTTSVDFQMILADDPSVTSTTYYFFAEIE